MHHTGATSYPHQPQVGVHIRANSSYLLLSASSTCLDSTWSWHAGSQLVRSTDQSSALEAINSGIGLPIMKSEAEEVEQELYQGIGFAP